MSIGDCDSATVRSATRVPVTITVSRVLAAVPACWAAATNGEPPSATATAAAIRLVLRVIGMGSGWRGGTGIDITGVRADGGCCGAQYSN